MQFLTSARGKLKRLATRYLGQMTRAAGQETMLRILIRSTGHPSCATSAEGLGMVLDKTRTVMSSFTELA